MASEEEPVHNDHYNSLAGNFEDVWFFDDGYIPWVCTSVVREMEMKPSDNFVDIGGGTGNYTSLIAKEAGLTGNPLVVDLSAGMVEVAVKKGMRGLVMGGEEFSRMETEKYSKAMLKETVHHLSDRPGFFAGVSRQLLPGGIFTIITRPPRPQFPFFEAALDVFEAGQPSEEILKKEMQIAGFREVEVKHLHYPMRMKKERWVAMLRDRFMSIISSQHFTDEQLEEGISEVEVKYKEVDVIGFEEIFVYISGKV